MSKTSQDIYAWHELDDPDNYYLTVIQKYSVWDWENCFKDCQAYFADNYRKHKHELQIEYSGQNISVKITRKILEEELLRINEREAILRSVINLSNISDCEVNEFLKSERNEKIINVLLKDISELENKITTDTKANEDLIQSWKAQIGFAKNELLEMANKK